MGETPFGSPASSDPGPEPPSPPERPGPARGAVGLRVALYLIGALMVLFSTVSVLLLAVLGPERAEALTQDGAQEGAATSIDPLLFFWLQAGAMPVVALATLIYLVRVERRAPSEIGWTRWRRGRFLAPVSVAAAGALLAAWFLAASPWIDVVPHEPATEIAVEATAETRAETAAETTVEETDEPVSDGSGLTTLPRAVLYLLGFLALAVLEETMFRGYVYSTLRERFSWVHAAGLTNLLELALLSGNPSISAGGLTHIFVLGLLLAAVREKTGSLWTGVVFHATWNFLLATVFALPSDAQRYPSLRPPIALEGPAWASGGAYGPEGSWLLAALLFGGVTLAAMWVGDGDPAAGDPAAGDPEEGDPATGDPEERDPADGPS